MKKALCCATTLIFAYTGYIYGVDEKQMPVKIVAQRGAYIIQETVSFSLLTPRSLYIVQNDKEEKKHRISRIIGTRLIGITPEQVMLDNDEQTNPLYDDTIDFIAQNNEDNLYVVGHKSPATLYMFTAAFNESSIAMLSANDINDAEGKISAGIVGLTSGTVVDNKERTKYTFVAVKKHEGHFGESGSGIALLRYDPDIKQASDIEQDQENKKDEESKPFFDILDAQQGNSKGNKAYAVDFSESISLLSINGGLENVIYDVVDMYWDNTLQRCYIALQVKTKDSASDDQGACALLIGRVQNRKLHVVPVVPHKVIQGNTSIIGATGFNEHVSLHRVRTMTLNNGLTYLIVVGGNGTPEKTTSKVYAFPVVNTNHMSAEDIKRYKDIQGTIAKKASMPCIKEYASSHLVSARTFEQSVNEQDDFYTSDDMSVQVGGHGNLPGPINDITMRGDCVVVSVNEDGNGKAAGAFYSQAITNEYGCIVAWTLWQRVPGGDKKTLQVIPKAGEFRFLYVAGKEQFLHLQSTGWHTPQNLTKDIVLTFDPVQACVEEQFSFGSLYGITDYPCTTPGVSGGDTLSVLIALGVQKLVMMQTSECDQQGILRPFYGSYRNVFETQDGSFTEFSSCKDQNIRALSITGGDLIECGALSCSAIGVLGEYAWLFVGGSGGLAVLTDKNGVGWNAQSGLRNGFNALRDDCALKKIGNYTFIRKLVCCGNYLYILTNSSLDRIYLAPEQFYNKAGLKIQSLVKNITNQSERKVFFNDVIISSDLLLLATSDGLYSGIPGDKISLKKVDLPYEQQPVTSLYVVSPTGHENDFAYAGQVYVVARSYNYRETYIYRLFVDITRGLQEAVQVVYDCYKKDEPSYWIRYAAPQQGFVTDGMSLYSYCSRLKNREPHVSLIMSPSLRSKNILKGIHISQLPLTLGNSHAVRAMVRNSATGSWLVAGDFGLRVNM